tara:strand:- start:1196 stop:1930 length:735 start_codon:yes stop_codon:yes gene_type:complete
MRSFLLFQLLHSAHGFSAAMGGGVMRWACRVSACPLAQLSDKDWEELDGGDTVSDWDDEIAQMKAWQAAQAADSMNGSGSDGESDGHVDESAHLDDDDSDAADALLEEIAQRRAAALSASGGGSKDDSRSAVSEVELKRVLTAIEGVLNTMGRMETRMGNIETAIQKMATQSKDGTKAGAETSESTTFPKEETLPTASSGEAKGGVKDEAGRWDGTVDEDAYFDDDPDEDLGDWRDVKRLEKLL